MFYPISVWVGWVEFLFGQKPLFILLSCWHVIILISRPSLTSWEIARVFTQTVLWCMFWKTQHSNLKTSKNTTKNRSESCFRISTWSRQTTCKSSPMESLLPAQNTGHLCKVPNFQNPDLFSIHIPRLANKQLNQRNYYVLFNASWRILFLPTFYFYNVICINRHDVCIINIKELWKSYLDIYLFSIGMMSIMSDCWWTHFPGWQYQSRLGQLESPNDRWKNDRRMQVEVA